jgi:hypothetical protein
VVALGGQDLRRASTDGLFEDSGSRKGGGPLDSRPRLLGGRHRAGMTIDRPLFTRGSHGQCAPDRGLESAGNAGVLPEKCRKAAANPFGINPLK